MRIFINDHDKYNAYRAVLTTVANFHGATDFVFMSNYELYEWICQFPSSPFLPLMHVFFNAYERWFKFYQDRKQIEEEMQTEYSFNEAERAELAELINARKGALEALKNKLAELT